MAEGSTKLSIGGHSYELESDDDYLSNMGGVFEPETTALFETLAAGSRVSLDIGANVGCTALLLSNLSQHVHAFEPSPTTHHLLAMNTKQVDNVTTHCIGLGAKPKFSELIYDPANRSGGYVSAGAALPDGYVTEKIEIRTLDKVVKHYDVTDIDFMKLDVEGFELDVLRGAPKTLRRFRPIVALEMNHWCLNAFRRVSIPEFMDYLCAVFPHVYAVQDRTYLDLQNPTQRYVAMYRHILQLRYCTVVCAQDKTKLGTFLDQYANG